jgi:hypothetical protein
MRRIRKWHASGTVRRRYRLSCRDRCPGHISPHPPRTGCGHRGDEGQRSRAGRQVFGDTQLIEAATTKAKFFLDPTSTQPGAWMSPGGIPVDLMVPEATTGGRSRRSADVLPKDKRAMRRARSLRRRQPRDSDRIAIARRRPARSPPASRAQPRSWSPSCTRSKSARTTRSECRQGRPTRTGRLFRSRPTTSLPHFADPWMTRHASQRRSRVA